MASPKKNRAAKLAGIYADDAAAGKLLRAADELRAQQQQEETQGAQALAQARLRSQDMPVASASEWITNPYFTGEDNIWPKVREIFVDIVESRKTIVVLRGSAGWGKTMLGRLLMLRSMYEVGCYAAPHSAVGQLARGMPLRMSLMAVDEEKAKDKLFLPIANAVRRAGWFGDHFRGQQRLYNGTGINHLSLSKVGDRDPTMLIKADPTTPDEVVGDDLVAAHLTECNKYDYIESSKRQKGGGNQKVYDVAMEIYQEFLVRLATRFHTPYEPCVRLVFDSSERYEGDFIARLVPQLADSGVPFGVYSFSNWHTRPGEDVPPYFDFAKPKKGSAAEVVEDAGRRAQLVEQGREIVKVPEGQGAHYLIMARAAPDAFAQNIVGCPTDALDRFIHDPEAIDRCRVTRAQWLVQNGIDHLRPAVPRRFLLGHTAVDWEALCTRDDKTGIWLPRVAPYQPRCMHLDLATTGQDYVGAAMAGAVGGTGVEPLVHADFAMRMERDGSEYDFDLLRDFVGDFVLHGFVLELVTFDSYESFDFGQHLRKHKKLKVKRISLHLTIDGYVEMRNTMYAGRLLFDADETLTEELVQLERRVENGHETVKHRPGGHDDAADALAAVTWQATVMAATMGGGAVQAHTPRPGLLVRNTDPHNVGAEQAFRQAMDREIAKTMRQHAREARREVRREARNQARQAVRRPGAH